LTGGFCLLTLPLLLSDGVGRRRKRKRRRVKGIRKKKKES